MPILPVPLNAGPCCDTTMRTTYENRTDNTGPQFAQELGGRCGQKVAAQFRRITPTHVSVLATLLNKHIKSAAKITTSKYFQIYFVEAIIFVIHPKHSACS